MTKPGFEPFVPVRLSDRVRRLTANNPGYMTGPGTNTYIIGDSHSVVIDPGPAQPEHIDAILEATGASVASICVTHTHPDHSPAASELARLTGATLVGSVMSNDGHQDESFSVDENVQHEQWISGHDYRLQAIHTPGHVDNHFCYLLEQEGMLFTGDHIMEGSTVVIIPPAGDMADYIASLQLLKSYEISALAPGHGALVEQPMEWIDWLIDHRLKREEKVVEKLAAFGGKCGLKALTALVYDDVDTRLHPVASVSLWAHLIKLEKEGRAARETASLADFTKENWKLL
ncbi:MAG: MBL fold metallo-hydrolase [Pseudomonadales bacterium]|nr:MBL fold metallo-hydrolase [Pseudomonadales bacterium]